MSTKSEKCPTCGADAVNRSGYWEAYPTNGDELAAKLYEIEKAVNQYYLALDRREHGGLATSKALGKIQDILGMHWEQGKMTQYLIDFPNIAKFYK